MTFTSATFGEVKHPKNVLKEFLEVFNGINKCKADILSWLDGWTKRKNSEGEQPWVWVVAEKLAAELGWCRETIQRHVKQLIEMGLIEQQPARRWPCDRASKYRLIPEAIARLTGASATCEKPDAPLSDLSQSLAKDVAISIDSSIASFTTSNPEEAETKDEECGVGSAECGVEGENIPPESEENRSPELAKKHFIRLRNLGVDLTEEVRDIARSTPQPQLEQNIAALEEESAAKGLKKPIGAFKFFVKSNSQPRDEVKAWWASTVAGLGLERRDRLLQAVTELGGTVCVLFRNGRSLPLSEARRMGWEELAQMGSSP